MTALQLLRLEDARSGNRPSIHDVLDRQVAYMVRLVDDLLDVSRMTRGKIELRRERVELSTAVTHAIVIAESLLEHQRSELVVEVPVDGLTIDGDLGRLSQVIANLIGNAAKYSKAGGRIRVIGECEGGIVRLTVADQGIGIEPAYLERVFDQFVQVPQGLDRSRGGLGLGLAIVRSLVDLHGGTVHASSDGLGRGSTFVVELPFSAGPVALLTLNEAVAIPRPSTNLSVLIVDDNRDAAALLGEVLDSFGYRTRVVHNGPDALAVLAELTPDFALLDIGLPVMDGYQLAKELRSRLPTIRLIAVTGYGQPTDRERSLDAGFDAHLVKPVTINKVAETLDGLLA